MAKLLIIQPTFYQDSAKGILHKSKGRSLIGLTLPYLAALTPPDWEVHLIDDQLQEIDYDASVDVVALTTWTINSLRAYAVAKRFRDRGVPVIMGGPHTCFHAEEAAAHCDAVGIGEGEWIWRPMLEDAAAGRLKPVYRAEEMHPLGGLPKPRYDLLNLRLHGWFPTHTVQTSRGCPFKCDFCSERFFVGERYRQRPVDEVVEEIRAIGARRVFFADSMFAGKKARAMALMEALIPLKIRWSTLWTTYLCLDDEYMDLAKRSGLLHVNMGMESVSPETLGQMNKRFNKVSQYTAIAEALRRRGISYSLNFVFGYDGESSEVYEATLQFLQRYKVPVAYFYILDPHKGTPLYERLKADGRLLNEAEMRRRWGNVCKIKPTSCTPQELEARVMRMYERFYSVPSMLRRLPLTLSLANMASWTLNLSQRKMTNTEKLVENFDWA
jgi:radical SAM superfamily enzyme YgiQ (UPF0313 family)